LPCGMFGVSDSQKYRKENGLMSSVKPKRSAKQTRLTGQNTQRIRLTELGELGELDKLDGTLDV
jgi:hypothetical protein